MMIQPQPDRLIERICQSIEKTVLPAMKPSNEQRSLKGALWALRDLASRLGARQELLAAEVADMRQLLAAHAPELLGTTNPGGSLEDQHLWLQSQLQALDTRAQASAASGDARARHTARELRSLYKRMLDRELEGATLMKALASINASL